MTDKIDLREIEHACDCCDKSIMVDPERIALPKKDARALVAAVRASKKAISDYANVLVDNEGVCTPLRATKLNRAFNALDRFTDGDSDG